MPLVVPPELKKINPYIKRAEELDKDTSQPESRLVAYYCRQFAAQQGIPLAESPNAKACLGELLGSLEKEKPTMDQFSRDEAAFICRKFATQVFDKADTQDRAGEATKGTAKTFYAAVSFLQMLEQFGQEEDDQKKIVYAKWKATEILKAFKEGRKPTPGGYGMEDDEELLPSEHAPVVETVQEEEPKAPSPPPVVMPPPPPMPPSPPPRDDDNEPSDEGTEIELGPPPAYPLENTISFDPSPPRSPPKKNSIFGSFGSSKKKKASKAQLADATELTTFALRALEDKDVELAADRLQQALQVLGR